MLFGAQKERENRVDQYGSPYYIHYAGIIAANNGREYVNIQDTFPDSRKYEPLDWLRIRNQSGEIIRLRINETDYGFIDPGTIQTFNEIGGIWTFTLINTDTANATAANEVFVQVRKEPLSADKLAQRYGRYA